MITVVPTKSPGGLPSKQTVCELEHGPVEIVDLRIEHGDFPSFFVCKRLPGRLQFTVQKLLVLFNHEQSHSRGRHLVGKRGHHALPSWSPIIPWGLQL